MNNDAKQSLVVVGAEANKNILVISHIGETIKEIRERLNKIETLDLATIDNSSNRILDILTLLENSVFTASTDSAFLIELFGMIEPELLVDVFKESSTETVNKFLESIQELKIKQG